MSSYAKGRRMQERAFDLSQAWDYLSGAVRKSTTGRLPAKVRHGPYLAFEILLNDPGIIGARLESFRSLETGYVHAYRKAHRDFHERLKELETELDVLRPKAAACRR